MNQSKSMKKKIVVIGGGNGSALSVNSLKQNKDLFGISAVVSMSDSGGSSGRLRKEFDTLPPGDIMRAVLSMSPYDYRILKKIFHTNRFTEVGKLDNHNLGNLFIVLAEKYSGDFVSSIRALEQSVEAVGSVYPVTLDKTDLVAELDNGDTIRTEAAIDDPDYDKSFKIKKAWLEPAGNIFPDAKKVIEEADYILLGPGSLYTSVIATLLSEGVMGAIDKSSAKLIYICGGAREKNGETGPTKASDFLKALESHLPRPLDVIVCNDHVKTEKEMRVYEKKGWEKIEFDKENLGGYNIVKAGFEKEGGGLSPEKLGVILKDLINE